MFSANVIPQVRRSTSITHLLQQNSACTTSHKPHFQASITTMSHVTIFDTLMGKDYIRPSFFQSFTPPWREHSPQTIPHSISPLTASPTALPTRQPTTSLRTVSQGLQSSPRPTISRENCFLTSSQLLEQTRSTSITSPRTLGSEFQNESEQHPTKKRILERKSESPPPKDEQKVSFGSTPVQIRSSPIHSINMPSSQSVEAVPIGRIIHNPFYSTAS